MLTMPWFHFSRAPMSVAAPEEVRMKMTFTILHTNDCTGPSPGWARPRTTPRSRSTTTRPGWVRARVAALIADGQHRASLPSPVGLLESFAVVDRPLVRAVRRAKDEPMLRSLTREVLAIELERHRHDRARGSSRGLRPLFAIAGTTSDPGVLENRHVEVRRFFGLVIEPQGRVIRCLGFRISTSCTPSHILRDHA